MRRPRNGGFTPAQATRRRRPERTTVITLAVACGVLFSSFGPQTVHAQVVVAPALRPENQQPKAEEQQQAQTQTLMLHAKAAPDPLLKYRLWPAPHDQIDQNAWPLVSRAIFMSVQVDRERQQKFSENYSQWSSAPFDQLPVEEVRNSLAPYETALRELRRAENLMRVDYGLQLQNMSAGEMVATLLPEFQESRQLARVLDLRIRLAIAEGRWEDAIADLRLGFRLSEIVGHGADFLVCRLVGYAIAGVMMNTIEQAIQHPDCPNLYWSLAGLPVHRLFEVRESLEFESVVLTRVFGPVQQLPDDPIGATAARAKIKEISGYVHELLGAWDDRDVPADLLSGIYVVTYADASRELLAATDQWNDRVDELSAPEAVLRATMLKLQRIRDHWLAWSTLPPQMWEGYDSPLRDNLYAQAHPTDVAVVLANMLTPAVNAAVRASQRGEQTRNLLATLEAIRMHAAANGELPDSLAALQPVPAFADALASGSFQYERSSATNATLTRAARHPNDKETTFRLELKGEQ